MANSSAGSGSAQLATVGIVGVSGYAGMELARIVARHPGLALALAVSDKWAGSTLGERLPVAGETARLKVRPQADAATPASFSGLDLVFLCTPAEVSLAL